MADQPRSGDATKQAWLVLTICALLFLAIMFLAFALIERRLSAWIAPGHDRAVATRTVSPRPTAGGCDEPAEWITADDYPADAIRAEREGTTKIAWTVGDDGKVNSCTIVTSSGHPSLDDAACHAILARGCYAPAALAGQRTFSRRVVWRLPR